MITSENVVGNRRNRSPKVRSSTVVLVLGYNVQPQVDRERRKRKKWVGIGFRDVNRRTRPLNPEGLYFYCRTT